MKKAKKKREKITKKQFDDLRNQLARALADYDNLRKRVEKDKRESEKIASKKLFENILPAIDMFFDCQKHLADSGLSIALDTLISSLEEFGIKMIDSKKGDVFDERFHEAVEIVKLKDKKDEEIVESLLTGWKFEDNSVIRYEKVKVNKIDNN